MTTPAASTTTVTSHLTALPWGVPADTSRPAHGDRLARVRAPNLNDPALIRPEPVLGNEAGAGMSAEAGSRAKGECQAEFPSQAEVPG
ncbi:hypothetical protein GCM10009733_048900 [Nonomuraea maheshkhaliensis]|uniref:Uncharacterized protein n=1 Tax=Nonomuraea maheshkhaliensis TaxID=419590 RepID=A0ABP4RCL1_9ACTN